MAEKGSSGVRRAGIKLVPTVHRQIQRTVYYAAADGWDKRNHTMLFVICHICDGQCFSVYKLVIPYSNPREHKKKKTSFP